MDYTDKHFFNTKNLISLSARQKKLMRNIEEAEWLGYNVDSVYLEQEEVSRLIKAGNVYYPEF